MLRSPSKPAGNQALRKANHCILHQPGLRTYPLHPFTHNQDTRPRRTKLNPDFLQWFAVVTPFNMIGGLLIITLPRLVRTYRILIGVRRGEISLEEPEEEAV